MHAPGRSEAPCRVDRRVRPRFHPLPARISAAALPEPLEPYLHERLDDPVRGG
jgi:hypothetical protein